VSCPVCSQPDVAEEIDLRREAAKLVTPLPVT
jgi:hypothetical protein